jgi:hypothetical protein
MAERLTQIIHRGGKGEITNVQILAHEILFPIETKRKTRANREPDGRRKRINPDFPDKVRKRSPMAATLAHRHYRLDVLGGCENRIAQS